MSKASNDILNRKRQLHLRIGRSRRRINARLHAAKDRAGELIAWRACVVRHPGWSLAAALAAGLAASHVLQPTKVVRWLVRGLARETLRKTEN
jgi:hypothetical protein